MNLVLMTQYLDTRREIGTSARTKTTGAETPLTTPVDFLELQRLMTGLRGDAEPAPGG